MAKQEYQKFAHENKTLKESFETLQQQQHD